MKEQLSLTNLEKVAICGLVYQQEIMNVPSRELPWAETWKMCHPESQTQAYTRQRECARQWKQTRLFLDYWEDCVVRIREDIEAKKTAAVEEELRQMHELEGVTYDEEQDENGATIRRRKAKVKIDFTDRETFLEQINLKLNSVTDDKLKMDLMKMMADVLRYKEDTPDKANADIMRFYTPITCYDCPMYKERKEKIEKGEV